MDSLRQLTAAHGFFSRQDALGTGSLDRDLTRGVRQRHLVRFRRGAYAFADEWSVLDELGRHRVRTNAVMRSLGSAVALSHASGVVAHGIDTWGLPLDRIHVTRIDGASGRLEKDVVHHEGRAGEQDVVHVDGLAVLPAARCALEAASRVPNDVALALLDSGLRSGAYSEQELMDTFATLQHWPFVRHLHLPVRMADGRAGSVGESRGRWYMHRSHLPAPVLQYAVRDASGELIGTTDWAWPRHGLLGEFDGRIKYGRLLRPGQSPEDVVVAEKRREDRLREATGFRMVRFMWDDYRDLDRFAARLKRALRGAA